MNVSPAVAGALKMLLLAIVFAVVDFLANAANLSGVVSPSVALLIATIASGVESHLKAGSGGETGLFGAVRITK